MSITRQTLRTGRLLLCVVLAGVLGCTRQASREPSSHEATLLPEPSGDLQWRVEMVVDPPAIEAEELVNKSRPVRVILTLTNLTESPLGFAGGYNKAAWTLEAGELRDGKFVALPVTRQHEVDMRPMGFGGDARILINPGESRTWIFDYLERRFAFPERRDGWFVIRAQFFVDRGITVPSVHVRTPWVYRMFSVYPPSRTGHAIAPLPPPRPLEK